MCVFSPSSSSFLQGRSGATRSGAAGDGPLLLLVRAVTLQTRTVSNNALWPARASAAHIWDSLHGPHLPLLLCRTLSRDNALCPPQHRAELGGFWQRKARIHQISCPLSIAPLPETLPTLLQVLQQQEQPVPLAAGLDASRSS